MMLVAMLSSWRNRPIVLGTKFMTEDVNTGTGKERSRSHEVGFEIWHFWSALKVTKNLIVMLVRPYN
jgi:hypothetical protein